MVGSSGGLERLTVNQIVVGSSPTLPSYERKSKQMLEVMTALGAALLIVTALISILIPLIWIFRKLFDL